MADGSTPLKHRWRDAIKSPHGPESPILRLVLLVVADWLLRDATYCSPSISVLAEQTGLSQRAVRERLRQAEGTWFTRVKAGRGYRYFPCIPASNVGLPTISQLRNGGSAFTESRYRNDDARHRNGDVANRGTAVPPIPIDAYRQNGRPRVSARLGGARSRRPNFPRCSRAGCNRPVLDPIEGPYCRAHLEEVISGGGAR